MTTPDNPETPSAAMPPVKTQPALETWISRFVLTVVLVLAVIPSVLTVADRWFGLVPGDWGRDLWCLSPFLCSSVLPAYYLMIFGCFLALGIILFFRGRKTVVVQENPLSLFENPQAGPAQMRIGYALVTASGVGMIGVIAWSLISQHWPGWDLVIVWLLYLAGWALRAAPLTALAALCKRDGEFWVSMLLMHVAIVVVLAACYEVTQIFYLALILLYAAFANLWRFRRRVPLIFWVISITLVFYTININGWWTAIIGDDYGFHELAWNLAEKMSFTQIGSSLFQVNGVFDAHPYLSSFVQAISMKLLGHHSFGWRFSSLYLCALGVGLFYFFCKSFIAQRSALIAACLLAFSQYVMSFGKIGYNNLQALFALSLVLAAAAYALRWKQPFVFALLGSALALCCYLYPASLYAVPVPILLLLLYYPPKSRQAAGRWLVMIAVAAAMTYPILMQPSYWQGLRGGTLFNRPELVQSVGAVMDYIAHNVLYSILSFLYIGEGHYVVSSAIDPITAVFIMLGYFILIYQMRRQRFAVFTALVFVFFLFSVGSSHDRGVPPDTRMFMMLPLFALLGAWGMTWLEGNLHKGSLLRMALIPILLVAVAGANLYQTYKISPMRYAATQSTATLFLAVTENIQKAQPDKPKNIAVILENTWGFDSMLIFQDVYPYLDWFHLFPVIITAPALPQDRMALLSDPDTIILVPPYITPEWQNTLDAPLSALGKTRCALWVPDERKLMVFYYPPDLPPEVCQIDNGLSVDEKTATANH